MNHLDYRDAPAGYADADMIAILYGRAVGTIYRLASTDHWHRTRYQRRTMYWLDDVDRTFVRIDTP